MFPSKNVGTGTLPSGFSLSPVTEWKRGSTFVSLIRLSSVQRNKERKNSESVGGERGSFLRESLLFRGGPSFPAKGACLVACSPKGGEYRKKKKRRSRLVSYHEGGEGGEVHPASSFLSEERGQSNFSHLRWRSACSLCSLVTPWIFFVRFLLGGGAVSGPSQVGRTGGESSVPGGDVVTVSLLLPCTRRCQIFFPAVFLL